MRISIKKNTGFSLLELMAVVAIAMILTIVAVNSYSAMKQRRSLRSGAESVRDALMNARSLSVSRNSWHRLVVQTKDPSTNVEKFGFWIDEIDPGTSTNPNPVTLAPARRGLVVPWQSLPPTVQVINAEIKGTTYTVAAADPPYLIFRFMPNGTSDPAIIRLREDTFNSPGGRIVSEIKLYSATAKSKIVAAKP